MDVRAGMGPGTEQDSDGCLVYIYPSGGSQRPKSQGDSEAKAAAR